MRLLDKIASSNVYSILFLLFLSSFYFVGLGHVHLFDWDEINFAETAREMIESGDYLRVQINYLPFWEKPPFFFWLQVGAMKLFGVNEFAARFPNALFGFLYLWTFYKIGKLHFNARFGILWALLYFGSLLPHLYFKSGIIDPVFNYFIFLSIYFMLRVFSKQSENIWKLALLSGIFSGLSVITKGPVGFLLLGLTFGVYVLFNRFKNIPHIKHFALFLIGMGAIIVSWLTMEIYQNGFAILQQFIDYQIELFNQPVAGHQQPFYYHFVIVGIGCFPLTIFAIPGFWSHSEDDPNDIRRWMLSLFWVVLILFSITTTKIAHYSSMTYAPLSFIAAISMWRILEGKSKTKSYLSYLFLVFGLILSSVFIVLPLVLRAKDWLIPKMNDPFAAASLEYAEPWTGWEALTGVFFAIIVLIAFVLLLKRYIVAGIGTISIGLGVTLLLVLYVILPKAESISQRPAIEFYKSIANEDCYIETYSFKSYAQYFYGRVPFSNRPESKDKSWLMNGEIDKPVWMVSKITNPELDAHKNFKLIEIRGGFRIYKREIPN